eukprot:TRINITY_DN68728_c0_g1_i1.p1 TRINITY_DN68728_c0_g1~~TRINITY_DN68728_c0_g1_i1.p1  ORF type:complete len:239 (+),score=49.97 TRINITY_DN68728_c0_g1_i1:91-717(+)
MAETGSKAPRHSGVSLDVEGLDRRAKGPSSGGASAGAASPAEATEEFTPSQIAECIDLFQMFDQNGDRNIDRTEFGPMMRALGLPVSERELDTIFGRMDGRGHGCIEFEELSLFLQKVARPMTVEEELEEAYRYLTGGEFNESSGAHITKSRLRMVMMEKGEDITEAECGDMIAAATDGKEFIDFKKFKRMCGSTSRTKRQTRFEDTA